MKRSIQLILCLSLIAPAICAHATRHRLPGQLRSRISLARQLSHGNVKRNKTMGASEAMFVLQRKQFERAVLKMIFSAKVNPHSKQAKHEKVVPREHLDNVQRLYNELPAAFSASIKGRSIPFFRKRTSKLPSGARAVLRSSVDRWMTELGLSNMKWILRNNDKPMSFVSTIPLDTFSGDITKKGMDNFKGYWGLKGMWH